MCFCNRPDDLNHINQSYTKTTIHLGPTSRVTHNTGISSANGSAGSRKVTWLYLLKCFVPGFIWRRLLCQAIGLGGAVGGAVLWTNFFLSTIRWWQLQAGPDTLPLLRCITDGQTPLLLDEQSTHTHRGQRRILLSRTQQSNAQLMEPFCQYILSQAKSYLLPPLSLRYSMLLKIVWRLLIGLIGSRTLSELDLKLYMHVLVHSICFCYCSIFDLTAVGSYSSKTDTRTLTERGFLPPVIVLSWLSCSFDMLTYGMCHSSMQGWVSINS